VKDIRGWLDETLQDFAVQENKDMCRSSEQVLQRYVSDELYEIFFGGIHV